MKNLKLILLLAVICLTSVCEGFPLPEKADKEMGSDDDYDDVNDPADEDFNNLSEDEDKWKVRDLSELDFKTIAREVGLRVAAWTSNSGINPEELGSYYEGDIISTNHSTRNGLVNKKYRWPRGIVPYVIGGNFSLEDLAMIQQAMDEYHNNTCIQFIPRESDHKDYLLILNNNSGCWSAVGRVGGVQELNYQSPMCLTTLGTPIHEMMHAIGFTHEHNRYDRDKYVTIMWENIRKAHWNNFKKAEKGRTSSFAVDYNYRSVLHYSERAFSHNNESSIVPKIPGVKIGQRIRFSDGDIQKIRHMYECN